MKNKRRLIGIILLIAYVATVCYLCFGHFDNVPDVPKFIFGIPIDKIVHFCMFLPGPFLLWLSFGDICKKPWHSVLFIICAFLIGCLVAGATEIGQSYTTYRSGDPLDFKADALSVALSSIITLIIDQFTHLYHRHV